MTPGTRRSPADGPPLLYAGAAATLVLLIGLAVRPNTTTAAVLMALTGALAYTLTAFHCDPIGPVMFVGLAGAEAPLVMAFGLLAPTGITAAVTALLLIVLALLLRCCTRACACRADDARTPQPAPPPRAPVA